MEKQATGGEGLRDVQKKEWGELVQKLEATSWDTLFAAVAISGGYKERT